MKKLSTLIRNGSEGMEQVFGDYFHYGSDGKTVGCCALGAAIRAFYPEDTIDVNDSGLIRELRLADAVAEFPKETEVNAEETIDQIVIRLNDKFGWSFEKIATWLESIGY